PSSDNLVLGPVFISHDIGPDETNKILNGDGPASVSWFVGQG
ncbi:unnamed protein product, partial [Arabidopsis halleri]